MANAFFNIYEARLCVSITCLVYFGLVLPKIRVKHDFTYISLHYIFQSLFRIHFMFIKILDFRVSEKSDSTLLLEKYYESQVLFIGHIMHSSSSFFLLLLCLNTCAIFGFRVSKKYHSFLLKLLDLEFIIWLFIYSILNTET